MRYEIAQQLKIGEREHERNKGIRVKVYRWVVRAQAMTWQDAKAQCKTLKGARIYPVREQVTA